MCYYTMNSIVFYLSPFVNNCQFHSGIFYYIFWANNTINYIMNNIIHYIIRIFNIFWQFQFGSFSLFFEHIKLYKLRKLQYVLTFVKRGAFFGKCIFKLPKRSLLAIPGFSTTHFFHIRVCSKISSHDIHQRK